MSRTVFAYLDAGSVSIALQAIFAGAAAAYVGLKVFGRRIGRLVGIGRSKEPAERAPEDVSG